MIRRLLITAVVAALLGVFAPAAHADTSNVYITPGAQKQNGRLWSTSCQKYSSTVVRCTTNIWATQIGMVNGRFAPKTGWHFNNLTYLPSKRAQWAGNNLAASGR